MGKAHEKLIFYTCVYQVEFSGGEVTEITTNLLQTQCMPSVMQMGMSIYSLIC